MILVLSPFELQTIPHTDGYASHIDKYLFALKSCGLEIKSEDRTNGKFEGLF